MERRERRRQRRKRKQPNVEIVVPANPVLDDEQLYDIPSRSVEASSHFADDIKRLESGGNAGVDLETELVREKRFPREEVKRASSLPTLPPGYLNGRLGPPKDLPNPRNLMILGIFCGALAGLLGVLASMTTIKMMLAGMSGSSFIDPILGHKIDLVNDPGVRLSALVLFFASAAIVVGAFCQLAGTLIKDDSPEPKPLWPDRAVGFGAIALLVVTVFCLAVVYQTKSRKLHFRQIDHSRAVKSAAERGRPMDASYVASVQKELDENANGLHRAVSNLFAKSIPYCALAAIVAIISLVRYQNMRRLLLFA